MCNLHLRGPGVRDRRFLADHAGVSSELRDKTLYFRMQGTVSFIIIQIDSVQIIAGHNVVTIFTEAHEVKSSRWRKSLERASPLQSP